MSRLARVRADLRRIPGLLAEARAADHALPPDALLDGPIDAVGVGLSGGPARLLAAQVGALGGRARFVPPSAYAAGPASPTRATTVLYSQGLSPNARLALRAGPGARVAFTGLDPEADEPRAEALRAFLGPEGYRVSVPSDEDHGLMVRFHAPLVAAYATLRWLARARPEARWAKAVDSVPERWAEAFARSPDLRPIGSSGYGSSSDAPDLASGAPLVLVTAGRDPAELHHLAWKWAEALFEGPPVVVDALELAHGPLQAFWDHPRTVVGLVDPGTEALFERVGKTLEAERHRFVPVEARLPAPLSLLEHDAVLDAWILAAFEADPSRLDVWPGRGQDAPLYRYPVVKPPSTM